MTYTTAQVNGWYQSVQFRDGPTASVNSYVSLLNSGGLTPAQVQTAVINDTYTFANANSVIRIYQGAFNRVPDAAGQNYWTDIMGATPDAGKPAQLQTIATQFANSTEFLAVYGVNGSAPINGAVLTAFYQNILQRAPDTAGYAYWLNSGQNVAQVLNAFSQSNEFVLSSGTPTTGFQQAQIAGTAATSGPLWQYGGGSTGETYVLTTNADIINGTPANDKVVGVVVTGGAGTTLQVFDQINGAGGSNSLDVNYAGTDVAFDASAIPTLNNIQIVNISSAAGDAAGTMDASVAPQITTLGFSAPIAAAGAGSFTVANTQEALNTYNISNIARDDYDFVFTSATGVHAGAADAATINLNAVKGASSAGSAGPLIEFRASAITEGYETVTVNSTGTNILERLTVEGSGGTETMTKLVLKGAGSLKINDTLDFKSTTGTIDASAMTGNVDLKVGTETITATLGSGNDTLRFASAGDLNSSDSINMGSGVNTLIIADTAVSSSTTALNTAINAITTAQIVGFSEAASVDASLLTANKILSLNNVDLTVTKLASNDFILVEGANVAGRHIDLTATLGFNTANVVFTAKDAVASTSLTLNVTNQATINIESVSDSTALRNLTGVITNTANALFTVTGNGNIAFGDAAGGDALAAAAVVNASALTGTITVIGANGASLLQGGTGNDTITGKTVAGGDQLVGNAGDDTLALLTRTGTTADTVTGGLGADTLAYAANTAAVTSLLTYNATAADSFATTGRFDTVNYADGLTANGGNDTTVDTGVLSSTLTVATSVNVGSTVVASSSWLAVRSSGLATAGTSDIQLYQDSNANGVIDSTDFRVDFNQAGDDTLAVSVVGGKAVISLDYLGV